MSFLFLVFSLICHIFKNQECRLYLRSRLTMIPYLEEIYIEQLSLVPFGHLFSNILTFAYLSLKRMRHTVPFLLAEIFILAE